MVEDVCIPPNTQGNVPVKLTLNRLRITSADWLLEPKKFHPGVFGARTLLSDTSQYAAVQIANPSAFPFHLPEGKFLGEAMVAVGPEA